MNIDPKPIWFESQKLFDPRQRSTLRGLRKCPSCGGMYGQRSTICKNLECDLRKKMLLNVRPFDPIQLIDYSGSLLFSLRSKEREANNRNFVQISEITLSLQPSNAAIISKNAVCFVESCKYDGIDTIGVTCKHIKACKNEAGKGVFPKAQVYNITREVLYNMNISMEQKNHIWEMYKAEESKVPAVQRLNETTFVVKSSEMKLFPAGRLHVSTLFSSGLGKKNHHACTCKKMKIIVGDDNSVVMQDEVCDHIIMLLAAILSHPNGKTNYENFVKSLKTYWMPQTLNTPVLDVIENDHFLPDDLDLCNNNDDPNSDDGIFLFNETFMTNEVLPGLSDVILEFTSNNNNPISSPGSVSPLPTVFSNENNVVPMNLMSLGDPNLMCSSDLNEDSGMDLQSITTFIESIQQSSPDSPQLELTDCNIELMDQFQLTDQLDICSNDLPYPIQTNMDQNDGGISIFSPQVETTMINYNSTNSLLKTNVIPTLPTTISVVEAPPIELPTIEVVKKCPVKISEIVDQVNTRKFPPLPAKRALIVNDTISSANAQNRESVKPVTEPALAYAAWLEYVIECINESVAITDQSNVYHNFHVHEEIFAHFSKSFSVGNKLRIPNSSTTVKHGSRKGLTKYTWYFTTASTVKRIFQTKNICIALDRYYELDAEGSFVQYIPNQIEINAKGRRIYPKLKLYTSSINFGAGDSKYKTGLKIEWTPKVFPISNFGFLTVEFSIKVRQPQIHLPNKTA